MEDTPHKISSRVRDNRTDWFSLDVTFDRPDKYLFHTYRNLSVDVPLSDHFRDMTFPYPVAVLLDIDSSARIST